MAMRARERLGMNPRRSKRVFFLVSLAAIAA
jgi:hypothetical protein